MKVLRRIAVLLAAVLTAGCLVSCGAADSTGEAESTEVSAELSTVSESEVSTEAQTAAQTTKAEKPKQGKTETTLSEQDIANMFAYGVWNDGSHLEYRFETDGTGSRTDTSAGTTEKFRFEVNEKKGTITFFMGENEKKQKADFRNVDASHLTLTFSKNETLELTFGTLIRKGNLPFRMGTWKSTNNELYTFRPDGSGQIVHTDNGGSATPFQYEVNPEDTLLIMHIGSADDLSPAVYTLSDNGLHMMIAYEFDYAELTWQSKEEK